MRRSGDPYADFDAYDREQQDAIERYPICECCGEHIQSERLYYIDGRFFCEECIEDCHKYTDYFVDEE